MFGFFIFSLLIYVALNLTGKNNRNSTGSSDKYESYPSGLELKRELRKTVIYDYDLQNLNYELIDNYIFRDYVYNFEKVSGYTRDVAIRKALDKYIKVYKIM